MPSFVASPVFFVTLYITRDAHNSKQNIAKIRTFTQKKKAKQTLKAPNINALWLCDFSFACFMTPYAIGTADEGSANNSYALTTHRAAFV
jgi:hypothetical protein